jgi:hypothetical protein
MGVYLLGWICLTFWWYAWLCLVVAWDLVPALLPGWVCRSCADPHCRTQPAHIFKIHSQHTTTHHYPTNHIPSSLSCSFFSGSMGSAKNFRSTIPLGLLINSNSRQALPNETRAVPWSGAA